MMDSDWDALITNFREKFGKTMHDAELLAQSFYESFEEQLQDGLHKAATLAHVVSLAEEEREERGKPEPPGQLRQRRRMCPSSL